jgi:hypothetical protein
MRGMLYLISGRLVTTPGPHWTAGLWRLRLGDVGDASWKLEEGLYVDYA